MSAADAGRDRAREELFDLFDRVVTIAKQLEAAKNKVTKLEAEFAAWLQLLTEKGRAPAAAPDPRETKD